MVRRKRILTACMLVALLSLLAFSAMTHAADKPTVVETYQVKVDDVGDGHITDTIKYSKDDYDILKKVQAKKRGFLTRRFTTEDSVGEIVDFKTEMVDKSNSVVITYDRPGLAYNTKGSFVLYDYSEKPKSSSGNQFTFEETSTVNSEFTLFTDQVFKTTTEISLPASASKARYDATEKSLKYDMPAARTLYGLFSEQKGLMATVFGLLTVVFAALLVYVYRRQAVEPAPVLPVPPASVPAQPPVQQPAQAAAPEPSHKFCEQCGSKLDPGTHFCTGCGSRAE
jgi:hypothetical protein